MRKPNLLIVSCILLLAQASLTSCQDFIDSIFGSIDNPVQNNQENTISNNDGGDNDPTQVLNLQEDYQAAFVRAFGVPGVNHMWGFASTKEKTRIMVEELSTEPDFDFNDVVFDVIMTSTGADVTLQAVGSTLPITIGGQEVHEKFGVSTTTMVNTNGSNIGNLSPVTFSITGVFYDNPINIEVKVYEIGQWYDMVAVEGKAPNKVAVSTTNDWCVEKENIANKYSQFISWVSGSSNDL